MTGLLHKGFGKDRCAIVSHIVDEAEFIIIEPLRIVRGPEWWRHRASCHSLNDRQFAKGEG